MPRLCFLNPFGTDAYDELIASTLLPSLRGSTEVEIRHLAHAPRDIDYYAPKHLAETEIMAAAVAAEREGFDAFVIGCRDDAESCLLEPAAEPPSASEQIDSGNIHALPRRNKARHAACLRRKQAQKPVLAGAADAQAVQPDARRPRVREDLLCAGHLPVGED
jgi:hypothetical protein